MWRVYLSCQLNHRFFSGDPAEMLCARAYRENWQTVWLYNLLCFWHWGKDHCRICFEYHLDNGHYWKEREMDREEQPTLPFDARFRQAEQYSFDLGEVPQTRKESPAPQYRPQMQVCIGNCDICPYCGNSSNRD